MVASVRSANSDDVSAIAAIHREAFVRQNDSEKWVRATLAAHPRIFTFVLEQAGAVDGYVFWAQKSGLRSEAVVELDQIAVAKKSRGRGFGTLLIEASFVELKTKLASNRQKIKSILISTRADSEAQRLYERALGATVAAAIEDLYSDTEVIMISKQINR